MNAKLLPSLAALRHAPPAPKILARGTGNLQPNGDQGSPAPPRALDPVFSFVSVCLSICLYCRARTSAPDERLHEEPGRRPASASCRWGHPCLGLFPAPRAVRRHPSIRRVCLQIHEAQRSVSRSVTGGVVSKHGQSPSLAPKPEFQSLPVSPST